MSSYRELCEMARRCGDFHPEERGTLSEFVASMVGRSMPIPTVLSTAMANYIEELRHAWQVEMLANQPAGDKVRATSSALPPTE